MITSIKSCFLELVSLKFLQTFSGSLAFYASQLITPLGCCYILVVSLRSSYQVALVLELIQE